ncbi:ribosomal biogenesis protein-like protein [Leptotrombidium deliense]|uniref:Ribosome production factor 2 homolog n=1 Tax=Leptotrombidium deliense TaxID=299467 RepID=A0A443SGK0_9ACAR|nr:ribosomal biogenesis protein-like protein [Leptotrombidium deliense]
MESEVRRAKTRKGRVILENRKGKLIEDEKNAAFVKGPNVRSNIVDLMKETATLKKPNSVTLNRKHDFRPFENVVPLELMVSKNDCSLFMFGSHTKKRPNNLVIGRTYHRQILDMMEFEVTNFKSMKEFGGSKLVVGSKPILLFSGEQFETEFEYQRMKNLFIDFYSGNKTDAIRLHGLQHVISFVASEGVIHFRCYKISLLKTATKLPRVELKEMGPNFELKLRRHKLASDSLMKTAQRQPKQLKARKVKNVRKSVLGTTFGRIHMKRQDYGELQTRKLKGLKRSSIKSSETKTKKVRFSMQNDGETMDTN